VGCGRVAPKSELVRFREVDGVVMRAADSLGRGAYTCRDAACIERALARRAFARAFRHPVLAEPELARLYTEESHG
jgi:predicted RNA-binding protein YlxR (DUF448 family)